MPDELQEAGTVPEPAYPIASVDSALRLIVLLADSGQIRITDASQELGVARSTAHRLLRMLQHRGFAQQDPETKGYEVGPTLLHIGLHCAPAFSIRDVARPHMETLRNSIEETVHLHTFRGRQILCIESVESPRMLRVGSRAGMTLPSHSTAAGQVILAQLTVDELQTLYPTQRLPTGYGRAIRTRRELETVLAHVRAQGYAIQHEQTEPGVSAIGVPIPEPSGRARFSLSVAAPSGRLAGDRVNDLFGAIQKAAETISLNI